MTTLLYILLTLLLLSIMVVIHELGHFLFAKLFKVTVLEFSVGMGPAIFTTKKKNKKEKNKAENKDLPFDISSEYKPNDDTHKKDEDSVSSEENAENSDGEEESDGGDPSQSIPEKTVFSVRAFPIGGFVSMAGEEGTSDDPNAFCNKKAWQKLIISIAGPLMNIILGIVCMLGMVLIEANMSDGIFASTTVYEFATEYSDGTPFESVSDKCEDPLKAGDKIIKVGSAYVFTGNDVNYEILNKGFEPIDLLVERNGEKILLKDVSFPTTENQGVSFGVRDFIFYGEKASFSTVMRHTFARSLSSIKMVLDSIVSLVDGRYGFESVSGPVGVSGAVGEAAKAGGTTLLYLFIIITMNLGVFNLLPLPALDGGHIIFHLIELITGKPIKKEIADTINGVGFILLMALALIITFKDILNLF